VDSDRLLRLNRLPAKLAKKAFTRLRSQGGAICRLHLSLSLHRMPSMRRIGQHRWSRQAGPRFCPIIPAIRPGTADSPLLDGPVWRGEHGQQPEGHAGHDDPQSACRPFLSEGRGDDRPDPPCHVTSGKCLPTRSRVRRKRGQVSEKRTMHRRRGQTGAWIGSC
jgi:hypothetical protein